MGLRKISENEDAYMFTDVSKPDEILMILLQDDSSAYRVKVGWPGPFYRFILWFWG